jgi:hypothetical protein
MPYQRGVYGATLNLYHFLQMMMDFEVEYLQLSSSESIPVNCSPTASCAGAKSSNKHTHMPDSNLLLNTMT